MPQLDLGTYTSQIFWLVLSFLAMFFIMSHFIVPKIVEPINQRQRKINDHIAAARKLKNQAEEVVGRYEKALATAQIEAEKAMVKTKKEMVLLVEKNQKEADERLAIKLAESEKKIADIRKETAQRIESVAVAAAGEIAQKIGVELSEKDIEKAIKQDADHVL